MPQMQATLKAMLFPIIAVAFGLAVAMVMIEVALRIQPWIQLGGIEIAADPEAHPVFHHVGPHIFEERVAGGEQCANASKLKVLLLGDSWMMGESITVAIGDTLAAKLHTCVLTVNGAYWSYSPTLNLVKAKQAVADYGRIDYAIVNIDETDIADEWLKYRRLIMRDRTGAIVAVLGDLDVTHNPFLNGLLWVQEPRLYSLRLIRKIIHLQLFMPHLNRLVRPNAYEDIMKYVFAPDARQRYSLELDYFQARLDELADTLIAATGDRQRVYVTYHPHAKGVFPTTDGRRAYLPVVSEALAKLHSTHGVHVIDARLHIQEIHGNRLADKIYVKGDAYSHLVKDAQRRYGAWLAENM